MSSPPEQPAIPSAIVEGVGSEVVVCVGILLAGLILVAAWLSTYVPQDMRPIAVFVFENFGRPRPSAAGSASSDTSLDADSSAPLATAADAAPEATNASTSAPVVVSERLEPEVAESERRTEEQTEQRQPDLQDLSPIAGSESHSNLAAYDVDVLESDGDLDPEMRERVEDVLHEYTQVMEARSDSELRNRRLKYFNCLLSGSPDSPEAAAAAAASEEEPSSEQPNGEQRDAAAAAAAAALQPDSPDAQACNSTPEAAAVPEASAGADADGRPPGSLLLRLKYFNDDLRTVFASPTESIANFKRRHFQPELSRNMNIRLIYNGRELKEGTDRTLASYAIPEEATIHCLVTERTEEQTAPEESAGQPDGQGDIGNYMFPLFGGILGLIWYCRVCYKAYFNFMSTMALALSRFCSSPPSSPRGRRGLRGSRGQYTCTESTWTAATLGRVAHPDALAAFRSSLSLRFPSVFELRRFVHFRSLGGVLLSVNLFSNVPVPLASRRPSAAACTPGSCTSPPGPYGVPFSVQRLHFSCLLPFSSVPCVAVALHCGT